MTPKKPLYSAKNVPRQLCTAAVQSFREVVVLQQLAHLRHLNYRAEVVLTADLVKL